MIRFSSFIYRLFFKTEILKNKTVGKKHAVVKLNCSKIYVWLLAILRVGYFKFVLF